MTCWTLDVAGGEVAGHADDLEQRHALPMLETIRDYAREKLQASDDAAATDVRHCQHYFIVAKAVRDGLKGPEQADWVRRAETELDNMRAAIALALAGGATAVHRRQVRRRAGGFWMLRGYTSEGRNIVRAALALPAVQASDIAHAHALFVEAALATDESDHAEARQMLETCLMLRRRLGHPLEIAATLSTLSLVRLQGGDAQGAGDSEHEALAIFRSVSEEFGEAIGLLHLGQIAVYTGDEALAQSSLLDCLHRQGDQQHGSRRRSPAAAGRKCIRPRAPGRCAPTPGTIARGMP